MKTLLLAAVAGGLMALGATVASATPVARVTALQPAASSHIVQADWYWNHHHWHHRRWSHGHWHYWN